MWSGKNLRKKAIRAYELLSASYHEAGHTVYGLLHFMKIGAVNVYINKKKTCGEGLTTYESSVEEDIPDSILLNYLVESEVGLSYSGHCAEKTFFKNASGAPNSPIFLRDGAFDDVAEASALIRRYNLAPPGRKRYQYKQKAINNTSKILIKHWDDVVIVSHALFQKKRLYYNDLKSLLLKRSPNKKFWREQFRNIDYLFDNKGALDTKTIKSIVLA